MKKILVLIALAALMIASMGNGGVSSMANGYTDIPGALPALPPQ